MPRPNFRDEVCFRINAENLPIRVDQVRARLQMFPVMVGSQLVTEPLTAALLWDEVPHTNLLAWWLALLVIHLFELFAWWRFRDQVGLIEQCRAWHWRFILFAGLVGSLWGVAAIFFFPVAMAYQALLICVLIGLTSGATTMNPVHPPALYLYVLTIQLSAIARIAYEGDFSHLIIAAMMALYTVVILNSGRQLSETFVISLRRRYENLALVDLLTKEKARAEAANREKSRFLATASHDLRQPLQALMLFSDAMQEMAREPEIKRVSGQITKSVAALVEMFDELLDVSRLEAGIIEVRKHNFELQPLLDRLYLDMAPQALGKGLSFNMQDTDAVVFSDPMLLERVLRNLLSNALRYTDLGSVSVESQATDSGVRIAVIDTGIGIHPDALPHIFDEFYQVENQHRDRRKGLGLGLAIVRRMEGLLGIRIEVESEPGRGTRFSFDVPRGSAEPSMKQPFAISAVRYDLRGEVIAFVEDDPDIRETVAGLMAEWGCRVFSGESGGEVIRQLQLAGLRPDLLVCDYRLPGGQTAVQVIREVREIWGDKIPALVVTGDTAKEALMEIHDSGAIMLHKPISPMRLRSMMYFALHGEG